MAESRPMTSRSPRSVAVALVATTLLLAACGSAPAPSSLASEAPPASAVATLTPAPATPAPTPSAAAVTCDETTTGNPDPTADANDPNAATYTEIEAQVSVLRGLTAQTPVARGVFDTAGLCAYLLQSFATDNPADLVAATETMYRELLLIPAGASLKQLYLDLLTSQVAGLYDDTTKHMYVVTSTGEIGPVEEITYAHEYTHALQDQAFVLKSLMGEATDQGDRSLARSAMIEGDATLLMSLWAQQHLTQAQLQEVANSTSPASEAVLASMPAILKDTLMFPYASGLNLALGAWQDAGGAFAGVNDLFGYPPDSTEQVLHPEKLTPREAPLVVAFPDDLAARLGTGWTVSLQDTIGELQLGIILGEGGAAAPDVAAAGWGGDRIALLEGPGDGLAVVLDTAWDTEADAAEAEAALTTYAEKLNAAGRSAAVLRPEPGRVVLLVCDSPDTLGRVAGVLGLAG